VLVGLITNFYLQNKLRIIVRHFLITFLAVIPFLLLNHLSHAVLIHTGVVKHTVSPSILNKRDTELRLKILSFLSQTVILLFNLFKSF